MRARVAIIAACAVAGAILLRAQGRPSQGQPTFTTSTDVVMVDVSVRKSGVMVTGLTAADFDLRDNGVKQVVETVESQAVPIDLSILIDVSGNPDRPWVKLPTMEEVASDVDKRAREITRLLRPGDRVRLYALDTYLQQLWALQPAETTPVASRVEFDGMPGLYDALLTMLLQPVEPKRRHVIVAETKGLDSTSVMSAADVQRVAEHSDAQSHLVMLERLADEEVTVRPYQCGHMDLCRPTYRFWVPARRRVFTPSAIAANSAPLHLLLPDGRALKAGAESTGGGLYQGEMVSEPTLLGTFKAAFENFRQSYILRYTPKGVARSGWHDITVTVPREKSAKIKSRNGYSIDAPVAAAPAPPPPLASNTLLRSVPDITRAYGDDAFDLVTRSLRQAANPARLIEDFAAAGNPWPAAPRREAALAVEIAEAGLFSPQTPARAQGAALLERFKYLVRDPIAPDAFEREWLAAAVMMLQGTIRPASSQAFVEGALARFPDDPRLVFARAVVRDQQWPLSGRIGEAGQATRMSATPEHAARVTAAYEAAAAFPAMRAEALVRLGWFLHRVGKEADALAKFEAAGPIDPADRGLAYVRELSLGQVLLALDRPADAVAAFRRATVIVQGGQSARVALMNALLVTGERDQAEVLARELQATPATVLDPWWMYWQGDYRRYPDTLRRLREMIR